mmetsp:Transcript_95729/g.299058  ORF Transcript_95729/g.299058 Transcript_95729/m.299058 type:complete len:396 (+) Transcript_95729:17-1204(+)
MRNLRLRRSVAAESCAEAFPFTDEPCQSLPSPGQLRWMTDLRASCSCAEQHPSRGVHEAVRSLQGREDLARRLAGRRDLRPRRQVPQHALEASLCGVREDVLVDGGLLLLGRGGLPRALARAPCAGLRGLLGLLLAGALGRRPPPLGALHGRGGLLAPLPLLLRLLLGGLLDLLELRGGLPRHLLLEELLLLLLVPLLVRSLLLGARSLPHLRQLGRDLLVVGLAASLLQCCNRLLALRWLLGEEEIGGQGLLRNEVGILISEGACRVAGLQVGLELLRVPLFVLCRLVLKRLLLLIGHCRPPSRRSLGNVPQTGLALGLVLDLLGDLLAHLFGKEPVSGHGPLWLLDLSARRGLSGGGLRLLAGGSSVGCHGGWWDGGCGARGWDQGVQSELEP